MNALNILSEVKKEQIIAVMRTDNKKDFIEIAETLLKNDIKVIEVTFTTPDATEIIKELSENENAIIGAGTVLDSETARLAILNGAKFIVSPAFDYETAKLCNRYSVPYIPGCMTINEMVTALEAGCHVLKLFPASQFTNKAIKDFKGPLPNIEIIPTGGIGINNYREWLANGSFAVGIGSEFTKVFYDEGKKGLEEYIKRLKER